MSIDLICSCKLSVDDFNSIIKRIKQEHVDIFPDKYTLYPARRPDLFDDEIAADFDFHGVQSTALISLNDTSTEIQTKEIADLMRSYVGEENILVLFLNETKI